MGEVVRAEMGEASWKEKYDEWTKRAKTRLPKWFGERPGKKAGDPETPEGEEAEDGGGGRRRRVKNFSCYLPNFYLIPDILTTIQQDVITTLHHTHPHTLITRLMSYSTNNMRGAVCTLEAVSRDYHVLDDHVIAE